MTGFLLFAVVITMTVGVHEYGHYLAMIRNGVHVLEFQIGVGPVIKSWTLKTGTIFSIRPFPIGGLARPADKPPGHIDDASRWARFKIYVAGMVMNCLLAMAVLLVLAYGFGVLPKFPDGAMPFIMWAPRWLRIPVAAFVGSFGFWLATPVMLWDFAHTLMSAAHHGPGLIGPVGIAHMATEATHSALSVKDLAIKSLMYLWIINIAVAQMNLLPIPALDGGRILMLAFERWLSKRAQQMLIAGSMLLLLAVVVYATYGDILAWFAPTH